MSLPVISYDELSDTLYVSFMPGETATGIELSEHILLRVNKDEWRAVGLTVLEYSVLAQRTELGPRSFPLTGLANLSPETQAHVLDIVLSPPVNDFLSLSAYTPSATEIIPIASLHTLPSIAA